jgi:hypothetical protein
VYPFLSRMKRRTERTTMNNVFAILDRRAAGLRAAAARAEERAATLIARRDVRAARMPLEAAAAFRTAATQLDEARAEIAKLTTP